MIDINELEIGSKVKIREWCLDNFLEPWCSLPIVTISKIDYEEFKFWIYEETSEKYDLTDIEEVLEKDNSTIFIKSSDDLELRLVELCSNIKLYGDTQILNTILNNKYIVENFRLHIKNISDDRYSIWFLHKDDLNDIYDKVGIYFMN